MKIRFYSTLTASILLTTQLYATSMTCPAKLMSCSGVDRFWQLCSFVVPGPFTLTSIIIPEIGPNTGLQVKCIYNNYPGFFLANATAVVTLDNPSQWEEKQFNHHEKAFVPKGSPENCSFTPQS